MKKKIFFTIGLLAFIMFLAGAAMLYNRLSENAAPGGLLTQPSPETSKETESTEVPSTEKKEPNTEMQETGTKAENRGIEKDTELSENETDTEPDLYPAPDFTVYDLEENAVKLSDFAGKPVVINFWASWCPPCKNEMPDFQDAFEEYGERIQFMMVNLTDGSRETVETASAYVKEQGYTFPVFYDTAISAAMTYGTSSIPASYFIDKDGNLGAYAVGMIDRASLDTGIDMILP